MAEAFAAPTPRDACFMPLEATILRSLRHSLCNLHNGLALSLDGLPVCCGEIENLRGRDV